MSTIERREYPRVPYGAWVENESAEGGLTFYLAKNLSLGGCLLEAKEGDPPAIGHKLRLRLVVEYEHRVMSVQGEVVRVAHDQSGEFAVRFVNLDETRNTFLRELVADQVGE